MYILNLFIAAIIGAFFGKFLATTARFLPKILLDDNSEEEPAHVFKRFFKKPCCWHCNHLLSWRENAPIIGYLATAGKCPHCQSPISLKTFVLEIVFAAIFGTAMLFFSIDWHLIFILSVLSLLTLCFITDFEHSILPDQFTLTLVWVGLLASLFPIFISPTEAIVGAVGGYGIFWFSNAVYRLARGREGMYPGDFKLNAGIGACFGIKWLLFILTISMFLLVVVTVIRFFVLNKKTAGGFFFQEAPYGCYAALVTAALMLSEVIQNGF